MRRSRPGRRRSRPSIWPWISFIVFACIIILLISSLVKKERPDKILLGVFEKKETPTQNKNLSKRELQALVASQDSIIQQLTVELEDCWHDDGFNKAYVNTITESLNMRSEPTLSSEIIIKIPNKSRVSILVWDDVEYHLDGSDGKWCRVKYDQYEGWVWGNYLEIR